MNRTKTLLNLLSAAVLASVCSQAIGQDCKPNTPLSTPDSRYSFNTAGNEVTDTVTGLTWRRCAEGMAWTGATCGGTASAFTWEQALAHAATQSGWRMPNIKELTSLVEDACYDMAINQRAFPATPNYTWSDSPLANVTAYAWGVCFYSGIDYGYTKAYYYPVRLVRGQ